MAKLSNTNRSFTAHCPILCGHMRKRTDECPVLQSICWDAGQEDLRMFIKVALNAFHKQNIDSRAIFHISNLGIHSPRIYKAKKFACKALKSEERRVGKEGR